MMTKPILVFGYGNASRGDDALGVLALEYIQTHFTLDAVELLTDFQLHIEHALDLEQREMVLFIDASVKSDCAFAFTQLTPQRDLSHTTHAMSPSAVLDIYQRLQNKAPPPCFLLAIGAECFGLGESLSDNAKRNFANATKLIDQLFNTLTLECWQMQCSQSF